jgi:hypothetical protein
LTSAACHIRLAAHWRHKDSLLVLKRLYCEPRIPENHVLRARRERPRRRRAAEQLARVNL